MKEKLVLGLGGTVDFEIEWDSRVIDALISEYAIGASEINASITIRNERDLVVSLLGFLRDGAGGERFVASSEIVEAFSSRFNRTLTLGGTGVRAAIAMQVFGIDSTLHLVSIDDDVRRLLPSGCDYICSAEQDSTDPHLIVQFREGEWISQGDIHFQTPHPNRVIFANDPPNGELLLSDELGSALQDAEVFMISGFNSIQDPVILQQRLDDLKRHMGHLGPNAIVYYEDAGFHIPELSADVRSALIPCVDVYSMNEDEMQAYLGRSLDLLDVGGMSDAMAELHEIIPAATLVVHTKYWSLAYGRSPGIYAQALQGGITMASTRFAYGDGYTEANYNQVWSLAQ
ncbi:hypothetical protein MB46_01530 [Arthrobacter alpinus]|uniref:ADP-dependent glucokinase/phosphofructokinase n=1 Tax=Arthrobacter alpinus TaxID=656366 RepID=UPI00067940F1|nr:ADP-dependent glucokinase/phosphofructokinase [Arthrobacter alpinus]ALV44394.1 hypothetical protein MB46_01530 [Arthrobacter alpinus]